MLSTRAIFLFCLMPAGLLATPANRAALEKHYDRFLPAALNRCSTCHLPSDKQNPESLEEFPHNLFGDQLKRLGQAANPGSGRKDLPSRLAALANEDSDGDGVANQLEILTGTNPGQVAEKPSSLDEAGRLGQEFARFLKSYRWQPFETVQRPPVPAVTNQSFVRNPIDAFISTAHQARQLRPRPEASRAVLLRRVYLDLIGLNPTPAEQEAFERDRSGQAYERVVDQLLSDPRYGERWGRHWMDIWRYSDWAGWSGGNQIRDSQPHIWRWRDWIVDSLNRDKGYDQMIREMLAGDELEPENPQTLAATGFLVRNYKMLSREQWLEDTLKHTSQAFLGVTVGCAKCHNHMTDPISQKEYYQMRAIFEPHQVRIDKVPGEVDSAKNGLSRVYDTDTNPPTWFFLRGDERRPDTNQSLSPSIPAALLGKSRGFFAEAISLPSSAAEPDRRPFVRDDLRQAARRDLEKEQASLDKLTNASANKMEQQNLRLKLAQARSESLDLELRAEELAESSGTNRVEWRNAATNTVAAQRRLALAEGDLKVALELEAEAEAAAKGSKLKARLSETTGEEQKKIEKELEGARKAEEGAKKKLKEAQEKLEAAKKSAQEALTAEFKPRKKETFPLKSTGRRTAFAQWLSSPLNPLTARVAVNHLWLRHFGRGLVPTPSDFGRTGQPPSHPELLDWLASEFMNRKWSFKDLHRLMVTSSTYRQTSTSDPGNSSLDPDNIFLWRMPSRRMEAELVRDNLFHAAGALDLRMAGPEIDHQQGLSSPRRSLYLRLAAEKEVEFLKIFDGPSVTECYQRRPSVVPQQALALGNSELAFRMARRLAASLESMDDPSFVQQSFARVLGRKPTASEQEVCLEFLGTASSLGSGGGDTSLKAVRIGAASSNAPARRQNLLLVLFNHNDFVTIR